MDHYPRASKQKSGIRQVGFVPPPSPSIGVGIYIPYSYSWILHFSLISQEMWMVRVRKPSQMQLPRLAKQLITSRWWSSLASTAYSVPTPSSVSCPQASRQPRTSIQQCSNVTWPMEMAMTAMMAAMMVETMVETMVMVVTEAMQAMEVLQTRHLQLWRPNRLRLFTQMGHQNQVDVWRRPCGAALHPRQAALAFLALSFLQARVVWNDFMQDASGAQLGAQRIPWTTATHSWCEASWKKSTTEMGGATLDMLETSRDMLKMRIWPKLVDNFSHRSVASHRSYRSGPSSSKRRMRQLTKLTADWDDEYVDEYRIPSESDAFS